MTLSCVVLYCLIAKCSVEAFVCFDLMLASLQLGPVVDNYRDLVFLAVDSGQLQIAEYLAHLGADLTRKELSLIHI